MQWVVRPGDGGRVGDVVAKMEALGAPRGRVFVNGRPAEPGDELDPGDRIEIYPSRDHATGGVAVLAQRDGVVLAHKPAGLPTETTQAGEDSLVSELIARFKGGRLHAASRLDVGVSGVVVCTLGRDASRRVSEWRARGQLRRVYLAMGSGTLDADAGSWDEPLGRRRDRGGRVRASPRGAHPKPARTSYAVLARLDEAVWLRLTPETGRMHQLRAHAALHGVPLFGDALYDGPRRVTLSDGRVLRVDRIALHAWAVELPNLSACAPVPEALASLWRALGGGALVEPDALG